MKAAEAQKQKWETESSHLNHECKAEKANWKWLKTFTLKACPMMYFLQQDCATSTSSSGYMPETVGDILPLCQWLFSTDSVPLNLINIISFYPSYNFSELIALLLCFYHLWHPMICSLGVNSRNFILSLCFFLTCSVLCWQFYHNKARVYCHSLNFRL